MYRANAIVRLVSILCFAFLMLLAFPAWAQRTGDGIVPSIETVCDGDPFSFGLCNAYCEALDCDSATPIGSDRACSRVLRNYMKKSDGLAPPCGCPCEFDLATDLEILAIEGDAEFGLTQEEFNATYDEVCDDYGPNDLFSFVAEAFQVVEPGNDPGGVRLFYWVDDGTGQDPASCNAEGSGLDGLYPLPWDWNSDPWPYEYGGGGGPWVNEHIDLNADQIGPCLAALQKLCPANP